MKKLFILFMICSTLMLCACSGNENSKSSSDAEPAAATQMTEEPTTQEKLEVQTPNDKAFEVSAKDIKLESKEDINPNTPDFKEITDEDAKVKIYNMLKNALECEPIDYSKREAVNGSMHLRAKLTAANGEHYRIFLGSPESDTENFSVQGTVDGNYLLSEEFVSEFYELLGIDPPKGIID